MASVDKQSVRDEVQQVKAEFDRLCQTGGMSNEVKTLMSTLLLIVELMLSIFLEKRTKKDSKNASIPPSQTDKDDTSTSDSGSHGKGKTEDQAPPRNARTVEIITVLPVDHCQQCGEDLQSVATSGHERRTLIDIVFEKVVDHADAEIKQCPTCQGETKADFPDKRPGPLQYGSGIKAYVINLVVCQRVALGRVQSLVKSMFGITLAESSILRFVLRLHQALESWEAKATRQLLEAPAMHVDETSLRVGKKNHWNPVYAAGGWTLKHLHRKRGLEAINAINIIPRYNGIIIHDCWASYLPYQHCDHGLCGSHLLRDLTFIIQSNGYPWARNMKRLLQDRNILTRGEKQRPPIPPKPSGKRGKLAKSDAHN